MRKIATYLAGGAVATVAALAAAQPAHALPIANGSMVFEAVLKGKFTVNTGDIAANTTSVTDPALIVQDITSTPGNLASVINAGDPVALSPSTLPIPAVTGVFVPISPFTITIDSIVFTFDSVKMVNPIVPTTPTTSGLFGEQFAGALTNGNGQFATGTAVTFAQSCIQAGPGALIGCGTSSLLVGSGGGGVTAPEPASLTILGAALLGFFGLNRRRRTL